MLKKIVFNLMIIDVFINTSIAYAAEESAGWELIDLARQGLFWICMFISFYGLYIWVLKKDGEGKKWVFTPILVYIASFILPKIYILIRATFSK
jgi:FtsH-binding integral membrane protein